MRETDTKREKAASSRRPTHEMWVRSMAVVALLTVVAFGLIIGRLVMLQIVQTDDWQRRATEQQLSDSIISPNRGTMYDTNMETLAESMQVWTVIMDPNRIDEEEDRQLIANELSVLLEVDRDKLYKQACRTESQYEVIKSKIERPLAEKLDEWVQKNKMGGVFRLTTDYKRVYPYGTLASCVLGFTGADNTGLYGLEAEYNSLLEGEAGRIVTAQNGWVKTCPICCRMKKQWMLRTATVWCCQLIRRSSIIAKSIWKKRCSPRARPTVPAPL